MLTDVSTLHRPSRKSLLPNHDPRQMHKVEEMDAPPLGSFEEPLTGDHKEVRKVEAIKAIYGLSPSKAPGPDKFQAEAYQKLPCFGKPIATPVDLVYRTGYIPNALRQTFVIPLPKKGKDPHDAASRRPITLLDTMAKIVDAVAYHRISPKIEKQLSPARYAYRRNCSAGMCLTEIMDATHRALRRGRWCYLSPFDIAGAFDNVSHVKLMETMESFGADGHSRRIIHNFLQSKNGYSNRLLLQYFSHRYERSAVVGHLIPSIMASILQTKVVGELKV